MVHTIKSSSALALASSNLSRELVDLAGIEPATSSMPWKRAPSCATGPLLREHYELSVADGLKYSR